MFCSLRISIGEFELPNPIIVASGPLTSSPEAVKRLTPYKPAAIVTKTIAIRSARPPRPNMFGLSKFSLLNCEDWSEKEYGYWVEEGIPKMKELGVTVIASIVSLSKRGKELASLARSVTDAGADAIELTCLYNPVYLPDQLKIVRSSSDLPIFAKISIPVLMDEYVLNIGRKLVKVGADAIVVSDTYGPCLHIDISSFEPVLGSKNGSGRLSGQAIKPFTMYFTALLARELKTSIISCGGISTWEDVIEAILLGASATEICSAILLEGPEVIGRILDGISKYLDQKGESIHKLRGRALEKIRKRTFLPKPVRTGPPVVDAQLCTACGSCVRSCPLGAIEMKEGRATIGELCRACGLCLSLCPVNAIRWS